MKLTIVTGFFLPVPPIMGGSTEKIWHRLAQEFVRAGHDVTFISRAWPGWARREEVAGVRHVRVPGANHTRFLPLNLALDFLWGVRVARQLPPGDLVICNTVTLPVWLRRFRPKAGRVAAVLARMPKGQGYLFGSVDLVLSLSNAVTNSLLAENKSAAAKIAPFPYPIDWSLHARTARQKRPLLEIGYIGRIHPEKGLALLLAAAVLLEQRGDLPAWRLKLIGPLSVPQGGAGEAYLAQLLATAGAGLSPGRVAVQPPQFDPVALAAEYAAIDIFCYPSQAEKGETFGVAVAEAMAAGAAVVVSGLACFRELVTDGETGLIFPHAGPDAAAQLAECLARLARDEELRRRLADRGQSHVRQFDFAASAQAVLRHAERVVHERTASLGS